VQRNKDTDFKSTVGKPLTQVVVGDRANVIVPVVLDLKERGKPNRYDGLANVVLLKTADVWKIAAFTWTTK
jgi:ketosteroid isomerase-like protein